jgi:flagellar L-ring protein precursor FlgH
MFVLRLVLLLIVSFALSHCTATLDRLEQVGKVPPIDPVENPTHKQDYKPVQWPQSVETQKRNPNSLWQPGARTFFRDLRARRVGDILKVTVKVQDKADLNNKTESSRDNSENIQAPSVFGVENKLFKFLPGAADPTQLLDLTNANQNKGTGIINRKETIQTQIAAMVTQILPNGNLVVRGEQQIRVNFEVREVSVQGIVRPEDISADNSISSEQIAEARISYGGRGHLSNVQQPRLGSQIIDAISPF